MQGSEKGIAAMNGTGASDALAQLPVGTEDGELRTCMLGRRTGLPLSFLQQQIWQSSIEEFLAPDREITAFRLRGKLNRRALLAALDRIVARHQVLRASFREMDGSPVQTIEPPGSGFALIEQKVGSEDALLQACQQEARQAFDLTAGPLIRGRLLRVSKEDHVVLITLHRLAGDGASIKLFLRELASLYSAFVAGQDDVLAPLKLQYADYAAWQRQRVSEQELDRQKEYWRHQWSSISEPARVPASRSPFNKQLFTSARVCFELPADLTHRLTQLSKERGTNLSTALLSCWAVLLGRWATSDDVLLGIRLASRPHPQLEHLIGPFENLAPLCIRLEGNPTVEQLLQQVTATVMAANAHQDVPLERAAGVPAIQSLVELNDTDAATSDPVELTFTGLHVTETRNARC
jgi:hypothetical protein